MPWKSHPAINKVLAAWFKGAELVAAWLVAGRPVSWSQMRRVANQNLEEHEKRRRDDDESGDDNDDDHAATHLPRIRSRR